jgi:hypothetical protein
MGSRGMWTEFSIDGSWESTGTWPVSTKAWCLEIGYSLAIFLAYQASQRWFGSLRVMAKVFRWFLVLDASDV